MTASDAARVTLRTATPDDEAAVATLRTTAGLPLEGVREALSSFVVADDAGALVGVAGIEASGAQGEHALLRSVAVAPSWQTRGLGRALVTHAIAEAEGRGVEALYLLTTTAEHYFPTFGFTVVTRDDVPDDVREAREYCSVCPSSVTVMVRRSSGVPPSPA